MKQSTNSVKNDWNKFCQLTSQERWLLSQAFAFMPVIAVGLHLMGFQRLHSVLLRFSTTPPDACNEDSLQQGSVMARLVQAAASRIPFWISCLVRSTTLWWFLRWQGIPSEIRIGVNQNDGEFHAHAWVETGGIVLNDRDDIHQQYGAFEQITLPARTERL